MKHFLAGFLVVILGGCASQYPDECARVVTHINTPTDLLIDYEVFPCQRTRTSYQWPEKEGT